MNKLKLIGCALTTASSVLYALGVAISTALSCAPIALNSGVVICSLSMLLRKPAMALPAVMGLFGAVCSILNCSTILPSIVGIVAAALLAAVSHEKVAPMTPYLK